MSEFSLHAAQRPQYPQYQSQQQQQQQQQQQSSPGVEWFTPGSPYHGAPGSFAYDANIANNSGAAYGTFDDEPPLLEELGIDIPAIWRRMRSILTFRLSGHDLEALDFGGPLIFMAVLGVAHLLAGKLHFGYILGWTVLGSGLLWFVLSSMAGSDTDGRELDVYSCCCLLGYSLLPLVLHALAALLLPRRSPASAGMAVAAVAWASRTAAKLFVKRTPALDGQLPLVLYPCVLMYSTFALLTLY